MKKYISIKVIGIDHWFWFEEKKVTRENGYFVGKDGWGRDGAYTNLKIRENSIEGEIDSTELQYSR